MLCVYNPLNHNVAKTLRLDLYYTGLTDEATITNNEVRSERLKLARDYTISIPVEVPANEMTWYVIQ